MGGAPDGYDAAAFGLVLIIELSAGQVVDPVSASLDEAIELLHPGLAFIVEFARRMRTKAARKDCENQGIEDRLEVSVEGTIYGDVVR